MYRWMRNLQDTLYSLKLRRCQARFPFVLSESVDDSTASWYLLLETLTFA